MLLCVGNSDTDKTVLSPSNEGASAVPIDENLFVDDDLEGLDEELGDLGLDQ